MKPIIAFFKVIRWPNLVFIILTQVVFRYCIIPYVYAGVDINLHPIHLTLPVFWTLVAASVCIAAAGYIINDYFDINIDLINKFDKVIISKTIPRRWGILLHALLSLTGLVLSISAGRKLGNYYIPFFNFLAIAALLFYSTTFKKKLLIGNVIISLLTAWVIIVLAIAEYRFSANLSSTALQKLLKLTIMYSGFAFIISLIREVVKDMEDMQGDLKYGCTTMPIVWGLQVSKVFCAVWMVVLAAMIMAIQIYALQLGWWFSAVYSVITIVIPLIWALMKLYRAKSPEDFHRISSIIKLIMLTGILSMLFFK